MTLGTDFGYFFDLTWKLLLVLGLAVLAIRGLKWLSTPALAPASLLKVLARLPIGPQQSLVLVSVGKKRILVGQTAQQITLLADLAADDLDVELDGAIEPPHRGPGQRTLSNLLPGLVARIVPLRRPNTPERCTEMATTIPPEIGKRLDIATVPTSEFSDALEGAANEVDQVDDKADSAVNFVVRLNQAMAAYSRAGFPDAVSADYAPKSRLASAAGETVGELAEQ